MPALLAPARLGDGLIEIEEVPHDIEAFGEGHRAASLLFRLIQPETTA